MIKLTDGTTYSAKVNLGGLPNIATPDGLARRLTNLGFCAGTDTQGKCNPRMAWAIRAFKRVVMNKYTRNSSGEVENSRATKQFLEAVQTAYGAHPNDHFTGELKLTNALASVPYCGMFGNYVYYRGSFETEGQKDDLDQGPGQTGIWEGKNAVDQTKIKREPIAGDYTLYLRAYDPNETITDPKTKRKVKVQPFSNRINLPQPIHMAQFVLFELGYWLVGGQPTEADWAKVTDKSWVNVSKTETRNKFIPNGKFGRYTQWAVREFQCHAKFPSAAKEDVASKDLRYMLRVFKATKNNPPKLSGDASYSKDGKVSGALNKDTRKALQAWADGALRCPVIIYSQYTDETRASDKKSAINKATAKALKKSKDKYGAASYKEHYKEFYFEFYKEPIESVIRENLWLYNDHAETAPRMYAIDYSGYYTISSEYRTPGVTWGEYSFPKPIVVGAYTNVDRSGCISLPKYHSWKSVDVEIRPDTMIGEGGNNGEGLSDEQLSTFKVVRTASHYECYGYFDCLNAYDKVTLSFGPCHWTLQDCDGSERADNPREMPAFLAYMRHKYSNGYNTYFGIFGFKPKREWPTISIGASGTYSDRIIFETENEPVLLCGAVTDGHGENKYLKNWHSYYRFLMATRLSTDLHRAMWDFTRIRLRDILDRKFTIDGSKRRVGDYVTSEKGVAMLLRWHIYKPTHVYGNGNLFWDIMDRNIRKYPEMDQNLERERRILQELSSIGGKQTNQHLTEIYGLTNVPQKGFRGHYYLNLTKPTLSSEPGSFCFVSPTQ